MDFSEETDKYGNALQTYLAVKALSLFVTWFKEEDICQTIQGIGVGRVWKGGWSEGPRKFSSFENITFVAVQFVFTVFAFLNLK